MAAGSGFKTFATGDVLTASDVNGYLMQNAWVFADAAARTAAVTSPQQGNLSFLKSTNSLEYYSGCLDSSIGWRIIWWFDIIKHNHMLRNIHHNLKHFSVLHISVWRHFWFN